MVEALSVLLLGYVPGALIYRLPFADCPRRRTLPAEERAFWAVMISVAVTLIVTLALAAVGAYQFKRLVLLEGSLCVILLVALAGPQREPGSPRPTLTALYPAAIVAGALWWIFLVPPAEFVIGGKDPGIYVNEGIQIAQRGSWNIDDQLVSSVPVQFRDLFFRSTQFSPRFAGFYVLDWDDGRVIGQFPHLYPASIAVAYGINGLSGAREATGVWAVLGLLAVYFAGVEFVGRRAALAGTGLLAVHVTQLWYSRYPNAEIAAQALLFGGLLAYTRAREHGDRFFAPTAAVLFALSFMAHITAVLVIGAVVLASVLGRGFDGRRCLAAFLIPLLSLTALVTAYYAMILPPYFVRPIAFVRSLQPQQSVLMALGLAAALATLCLARREWTATLVRRWFPVVIVAVIWSAAGYGVFFRAPGGTLAPYDADALRTFTVNYLSPVGLVAALAGLAVLARRRFWPALVFVMTLAVVSFSFFYKLRIVPEHFWLARRFLPVILPSALLLVGALAFPPPCKGSSDRPRGGPRRYLAWCGIGLVLFLGLTYLHASAPVLHHVEYAGVIPRIEWLAGRLTGEDLVLVEARASSDVHMLALPLAYIYAKNVLVFRESTPDRDRFYEFLSWARGRYRHIYYLGGQGTDLASRRATTIPVAMERFQVPEYQSTREYPRGPRQKVYDFGVYEFGPPGDGHDFDLDVGSTDDLHVHGFHLKETLGNRDTTFRWSRNVSFVSVPGVPDGARRMTIWLSDGGRPPHAPRARVAVHLNDVLLGEIQAALVFSSYEFAIPPALAADVAGNPDVVQLKLVTNTWSPRQASGAADDRELGVMVDRIRIE